MLKKWSHDFLILKGATEPETRLLQALLEDRGLATAHVPEAEAVLLGSVRGVCFAIRRADAADAAEILQAEGLRLEDFYADRGK
jgi:hypothetical protein